jgi:hypothetical protein
MKVTNLPPGEDQAGRSARRRQRFDMEWTYGLNSPEIHKESIMDRTSVEPQDYILYVHPQMAKQDEDASLNTTVLTPDIDHLKGMNRGGGEIKACRVKMINPLRIGGETLESLYSADLNRPETATPRDYLGRVLLLAKRAGCDGVVVDHGMVSGDDAITVVVPLRQDQIRVLTVDEAASTKIDLGSKDPLSAYMGLVAEVHTVMTDLTEHVINDHMGTTPDQITWTHVSTINEVLRQLQETRRFAGGPHANEGEGLTATQKAITKTNTGRRLRM